MRYFLPLTILIPFLGTERRLPSRECITDLSVLATVKLQFPVDGLSLELVPEPLPPVLSPLLFPSSL